jgi:general stress protein 26
MSTEEIAAFLEQEKTVICATNGKSGFPHLMPLWYLVRDGEIWAWTYAKSQKVLNLERDQRATLQVEAGTEYQELRGVMIEADTIVHHDLDVVSEFGAKLFERYSGGMAGGPEFLEVIKKQAAKRAALQFVAHRTASWDHRKLGGVY